MNEHVADIAAAYARAERVPASTVRAGDYVFSTFGKPDRVIRATGERTKRRTTITPEHLWPLVCDPDELVTIIRGER